MRVLALEQVSKSFKGNLLFESVSFDLNRGQILGIAGPNGSGKSVLFKISCGFVKPDTGDVRIASEFRKPGQRFPRDFGILIDRPGYIGGKTGWQNLRMLADIRGKISDTEIHAWAERLDLLQHLDKKVRHYSLGTKQKLALVQAFMEDQQVLLLDEPFNALDEETAAEVRAILVAFRDDGKAIMFTSHQQEDIKRLADVSMRLNRQKLSNLTAETAR